MRWTLRISFVLFLAWAIFMVSPFVALYDLSKAVRAKDLVRIEERVNFYALRDSLSRQLLGSYLKQKDLGGLDREVAANVGAVALNPVIEELVNPQALADLLDDGWPQQVAGGSKTSVVPATFDLGSWREAWRTFVLSESQGFRSITIPLPASAVREKQFRVVMRLKGTTWRLSGIDLPASLREELMKRASIATREQRGSRL